MRTKENFHKRPAKKRNTNKMDSLSLRILADSSQESRQNSVPPSPRHTKSQKKNKKINELFHGVKRRSARNNRQITSKETLVNDTEKNLTNSIEDKKSVSISSTHELAGGKMTTLEKLEFIKKINSRDSKLRKEALRSFRDRGLTSNSRSVQGNISFKKLIRQPGNKSELKHYFRGSNVSQ